MADDTYVDKFDKFDKFDERPVRWANGGLVSAFTWVCCLLLSWIAYSPSTANEPGDELARVTFVVGGMMKSRSGIT